MPARGFKISITSSCGAFSGYEEVSIIMPYNSDGAGFVVLLVAEKNVVEERAVARQEGAGKLKRFCMPVF